MSRKSFHQTHGIVFMNQPVTEMDRLPQGNVANTKESITPSEKASNPKH
jgi:hypothetical protein